MGFYKKFVSNRAVPAPEQKSSFDGVSEEDLERFLAVNRYGKFELTEAIRPSYDLEIVPSEGYRYDYYRDQESLRKEVPVIVASVTRERLFRVFLDLLDSLGTPVVDTVLETSHGSHAKHHVDHYRESIDLPVLKSILHEYEDLLCNDGCTGIAVLSPQNSVEIQFNEHKLLYVYANRFGTFEQILEENLVWYRNKMRCIADAEHIHSSSDTYQRTFGKLQTRLGLDHERDESQPMF